MDEPVISEFSTFYYVKNTAFVIIFIGVAIAFIYNSIVKNEAGVDLLITVIFCCISIGFCYYVLFKACVKLIVKSDGISLKYYLINKQIDYLYSNVINIGTFRKKSNNSLYGAINYQSFDIEFNNGKSFSFDAGSYNNYDELKSAIYKYKLGIE